MDANTVEMTDKQITWKILEVIIINMLQHTMTNTLEINNKSRMP